MIHYHGTPIGGSRQDAARFLMGRHALVSFYRPDDMPAVLECCQSFVLDNGAFSHWKAGKGNIDFNAYVEWVLQYYRHPSFDWCLIPDVIDGSEEDNAALIHKWLRGGYRAKGVPVWHLHESLEKFMPVLQTQLSVDGLSYPHQVFLPVLGYAVFKRA